MSTRSSIAYKNVGDINVHLYDEMHDDCVHLELTQKVDVRGELVVNNSFINIVIPKYMVPALRLLIEGEK